MNGFSNNAVEIKRSVMRNRSAWRGIRDLQQATKGLRPTISRAVRKKNGDMCVPVSVMLSGGDTLTGH